jgi:hypothetical protein
MYGSWTAFEWNTLQLNFKSRGVSLNVGVTYRTRVTETGNQVLQYTPFHCIRRP